jgi:hypothetical protein
LPRKKMIIMDESTKFTWYVSLATNLCKKTILSYCVWQTERENMKGELGKMPQQKGFHTSLVWWCSQSLKSHMGVTWYYTMMSNMNARMIKRGSQTLPQQVILANMEP